MNDENAEQSAEMLVWADALGFVIEEQHGSGVVRRYIPKRDGMGLTRVATLAECALWDALVSAHRTP